MKNISVPTKRGVMLNGALFGGGAETVVIAITGIHGNYQQKEQETADKLLETMKEWGH